MQFGFHSDDDDVVAAFVVADGFQRMHAAKVLAGKSAPDLKSIEASIAPAGPQLRDYDIEILELFKDHWENKQEELRASGLAAGMSEEDFREIERKVDEETRLG